jgi:hypothetical protein
MDINLTKEQSEHVEKYRQLYHALADIEFQIQDLGTKAANIIKEIEFLREEEDKLFKKEE